MVPKTNQRDYKRLQKRLPTRATLPAHWYFVPSREKVAVRMLMCSWQNERGGEGNVFQLQKVTLGRAGCDSVTQRRSDVFLGV